MDEGPPHQSHTGGPPSGPQRAQGQAQTHTGFLGAVGTPCAQRGTLALEV